MSRQDGTRLARGLACFSIALGIAELFATRRLTDLTGLPQNQRTRAQLRAYGAREVASGVAILAAPDRAEPLWSRVGGDLLDLWFLASAGRRPRATPARVAAAAGAVMSVTALDILAARQLRRRRRPTPERDEMQAADEAFA